MSEHVVEPTRRAPLRVLESGDTGNGTSNPGYGPGEEPRPRDGEPTASAHGELL